MKRQKINDTRLAHSRLSGECRVNAGALRETLPRSEGKINRLIKATGRIENKVDEPNLRISVINTGRLLETPAVALIFIGALAASCINTHAVALPQERVLAAQENAEAAGGVDTLATIRPKDGILLGAAPLRVAFTPSEGLSIQDFASRVRELAGNHEFYVVFDGLSVAAPPEVVYSIYLTAGGNEGFHGSSDPRYVGALHFFGAFDAGARPGKSMAFNVTELIRNLTKTGFETQPLSLWIVPSAEPEKSANPRVASIRLVAAR